MSQECECDEYIFGKPVFLSSTGSYIVDLRSSNDPPNRQILELGFKLPKNAEWFSFIHNTWRTYTPMRLEYRYQDNQRIVTICFPFEELQICGHVLNPDDIRQD